MGQRSGTECAGRQWWVNQRTTTWVSFLLWARLYWPCPPDVKGGGSFEFNICYEILDSALTSCRRPSPEFDQESSPEMWLCPPSQTAIIAILANIAIIVIRVIHVRSHYHTHHTIIQKAQMNHTTSHRDT